MSDTDGDIIVTVGLDTDQFADDIRAIGDVFHDAADEIESDNTGHEYSPETPHESFRALVWGAIMSGEKDKLTRSEMADALEVIAHDIRPDTLTDNQQYVPLENGTSTNTEKPK